ncbi:P-type ATPase [Heterostelium album PN500]|uniref:Calcium-transporting ATPase n=1 Tax=Heterostelium pallidum (strain ATCC 26659 / Pp 5 / PN500) TaxID=670386 RepID=D3BG47_HETP5|nr:P-type ATPase [Heterostelium album PN500]EFA79639.1 P-type ATPase [Heterostelium album PN500]|eukprot:XP_020431760.1 P-type ATPase [Heterostelium album PN500]
MSSPSIQSSSSYGQGREVGVVDLSDIISNEDLNRIKAYGGVKGLANLLGSSVDRGLSSAEASSPERIERFGSNRNREVPIKSFFFFVWEAAHDKTLIILIVAAIVSIILGLTVEDRSTGWIDGTAILVAVTIVVLVTAGNDYNKEQKFRKLNSIRNEHNASVLRDGRVVSLPVTDIVVGDIVKLEAGDTVPADGLYINGTNFSVDESAMTGESDSKHKSEDVEPFMLSGCQVLEGRCEYLVIAVGVNSQWGKLKSLLEVPDSDTPLTIKLESLAQSIGKFGLAAAVATFIILIVKFSITMKVNHIRWEWSYLGTIVQFLVTSIAIIVMAVPEGLPLAVTISLAFSMMKMMKDNNLVRHLEACETMGGATNICSDKTGTLTMNRMSVEASLVGSGIVNPDGQIVSLLSDNICLNSTAYIVHHEGNQVNDHFGSKTECALLEFIERYQVDYEHYREENKARIVNQYPFSSEKKMSAILVRNISNSSSKGGIKPYRLHVKGAAELVLSKCDKMIVEDGSSKSFNREEKLLVSKDIEIYASSGLRTLLLAFKDLDEGQQNDFDNPNSGHFTFLALVGIKDPVRPEVPAAVRKCQHAGITVRMLTGDNILTAKNIARECNILRDGGVAIEGPQFRQLTNEQLEIIIPHLQVLARCSPTDKYTLVHKLREMGEVVAVTGDGVNDAPQLKEADVGFSMGIAGTEVAKEASDIVLLDDNFSSIGKAVMWGRNVYDSIRKFIQFQLTVNFVAVTMAIIGAITDGESPLRPIQMLWVNLIMDTLGALALATEPPTEKLFDRLPYGRYDSLITRRMWRNIIGQTIYQLSFLFAIMYGAPTLVKLFDLPAYSHWTLHDKLVYHTIIFNTFVFCQFFNEINCRVLNNDLNVFKGIHRSQLFVGIMIGTIGIQIILVEFGNDFFGTRPLDLYQWLFCITIGAGGLIWGFCLRLLPIKDRQPITRQLRRIKQEDVEIDIDIESTPLLPQSKWRTAQKVMTEINVISAFRNQPRLKRTKGLFVSKDSDLRSRKFNKSSNPFAGKQ